MSRNSWWGFLYSEESAEHTQKSTTETATPDQLVSNREVGIAKTIPEDPRSVTAGQSFSRDGIPIPINCAASDTSESPSVASTLVDQELSASPAIPIPKQRAGSGRTYDDTKRNSGSIRSWLYYTTPVTTTTTTTAAAANTTANGNTIQNHASQNSSSSLDVGSKISEHSEVSAGKMNNANPSSNSNNNNNNSNNNNNNNSSSSSNNAYSNGHVQPTRRSESPGLTLPPLVESAEDNLSKTQNDHDAAEAQKISESKLSSSHTSSSSRSSWRWKFVSTNPSGGSTIKDGNETTSPESLIDETNLETSVKEPVIGSDSERLPAKYHQKRPSTGSRVEGQGQSNLTAAAPKSTGASLSSNTTGSTSTSEFISFDNNSTSNVADGVQTNITSGFSSTRTIKRQRSTEMKRWSFLGNWSGSAPNLLETTNEEGENHNVVKENTEPSPLLDQSQYGTPIASTLPTANNATPSSFSAPSSPTLTFSSSTNNTVPSQKEAKVQTTPHHSNKQPLNPLVATLPANRASWLYFFSNVPSQQPVANIESSTPKKLITNGSEQPRQKPTAAPELKEISKQKTVNGKDIPIASSYEKLTAPPSPRLNVKAVPLNKVLPPFEELPRFRINKRPNSIIQQTLHAINSYFFPPEKAPEHGLPKLLDELTRSTYDVKRIAIIGVHGWFPAKLMRAVVGQPTGTSKKFCDMTAKAVVGYLAQYGVNLPNDAITLMPLEGEGKIEDRVDILFKNLIIRSNWLSALSSADVVFVATHSQGTPVSTILLARLIGLGYLNPKRQRICMLAMAGINHGPFPYLKHTWVVKYLEAEPARELFEFMNHDSDVAKKYRNSLKVVTQAGVKLVYVASMDDQVVPLYSSTFTGFTHPGVLRAVYIDGPIYRDNDFLINLIIFAVRLRNSGIHDHNLMVHLSDIIAGSLTGEGHSALYEEIDVYTLAVRYLFEAASPQSQNIYLESFSAQKSYNPYFLPWAMRGIMDDQSVLRSKYLLGELEKLRKQYDEWEPVTKAMKDLKFRLEPLRESISKAKL